jgi:dihydroorotase
MKSLLSGVRVYQNNQFSSELNLLIDDGIIAYIGLESPEAEQQFSLKGKLVCPGWLDLHCNTNDPGSNLKDTLSTVSSAGSFGGFTGIAVRPTLEPAGQSREWCQYLRALNNENQISFYPIALATNQANGHELNELHELARSGAVAFSDGDKSISNADTLGRLMQYCQHLSLRLFQFPNDYSLSKNGQINEGIASLNTGLKGIPSLAEHLVIQRDLEVIKYYGGSIHFSHVTTSKSLELIREAKKIGLDVTCDVPSYYLWFTEEDLLEFNTYLKVLPPLRSVSDQKAILDGIIDGTIDAVVSGHLGCDEESKQLEFDQAEFGMENLETTFVVLNTKTKGKIQMSKLVELLSINPRKILNLEIPRIEVSQKAELTIFDTDTTYQFKLEHIKSKSKNNPFIGSILQGKVWGTIHNRQVSIADYGAE